MRLSVEEREKNAVDDNAHRRKTADLARSHIGSRAGNACGDVRLYDESARLFCRRVG